MSSWYDRAAIIPGGSNTRSKAPGRLWPVGSGPHFALAAAGASIQADDGQFYLDMLCGLGAISIGYGAVRVERPDTVCSLPYVEEIIAAEAVLEHVAPWASQVRFVRTGSEATHGALMVARRSTARQAFWRLRGSYHGWHEQWQADDIDVHWFEVGEVPNFDYTRDSAGAAAIIIEPPRWEAFDREWLVSVFDAAHNAGALVIMDEMIYGGRWALGGACEYYDVKPDLACYGKALGNGAAVAMIVGGDALAEEGEAVSGTYSGDAGALTTLAVVLREYRNENVIRWMWRRGGQLWRGLLAEIAASGISASVDGLLVHQRITFKDEGMGARFSALMAARSIIWHPACTNIMRAHTEADIERVVEAAGESLRELKDGGGVSG